MAVLFRRSASPLFPLLLPPSHTFPFNLHPPPSPPPLEVGPSLRLGSLGERLSSPAGPSGVRPPNVFYRILGVNLSLFD